MSLRASPTTTAARAPCQPARSIPARVAHVHPDRSRADLAAGRIDLRLPPLRGAFASPHRAQLAASESLTDAPRFGGLVPPFAVVVATQRVRLRCLRAAFAFARRLRIVTAMSRAARSSVRPGSTAGAVLCASRTITRAIAVSSTTAAPIAMITVFFEFETGAVEAVVSVFCVCAGSSCPALLSSLNAPPSAALPPADNAAGALAPARESVSSAHAQTRAARLRQAAWEGLDTARAYRLANRRMTTDGTKATSDPDGATRRPRGDPGARAAL